MSTTRHDTDTSAADRAADIEAIPLDVLPDGEARSALLALARAGHDVDVYTRRRGKEWVLWVRPDSKAYEGRWSPAQWLAGYANWRQGAPAPDIEGRG